jgi:hypothetical protein
LKDFQKVVDLSDLIIGYNILNFDNPLLKIHGVNVPKEKSFDILRKIWDAMAKQTPSMPKKGSGLEQVSQINLGRGKILNSAQAPILWQKGGEKNREKVIDYCLDDVFLTKSLFELIQSRGFLYDPREGVEGEMLYISGVDAAGINVSPSDRFGEEGNK